MMAGRPTPTKEVRSMTRIRARLLSAIATVAALAVAGGAWWKY
jgi:hypothetical protein